jgi:GTPase involved in cell partitioning and DNA repair
LLRVRGARDGVSHRVARRSTTPRSGGDGGFGGDLLIKSRVEY